MRNRFFFIILATLILSAVGINFVQAYFFRNQKINLMDYQLAETEAALLHSKEFMESLRKPKTIQNTISKVLQGMRIGKVFVVRDANNKIMYQSFNVDLLGVEMPVSPKWVAVETKSEYVRLKNIPISGPKNLTLQLGTVVDRNFLEWKIINRQVIAYVTGIVLSVFLVSVLLTLVLLSPLRALIGHLNEATSNLTNLRDVNPLPTRLTRLARGFWARSDEFSVLINTVNKLIDRINSNYKLTRSWTLQMAHEFKTPLAIIRAQTEARKNAKQIPDAYAEDVFKEIENTSEIVGQFLDWAELENLPVHRDLHALRLRAVIKSVVARLESLGPGRIRLKENGDFQIFANPIHLEQLIINLLTNALKFSPKDQPVEVELTANRLVIRDHGPGIASEVMERIGQPFNVGSQEDVSLTGNGLGLAWVSTVARLYQWKLEINTDPRGTKIELDFPPEESSS